MKKVLFAINNFSVGGAERMALHQARFLDREKFDVWMATLLPDPERNYSRDAEFLGEKLKRFRMRGFLDIKGWWSIFLFLRRERFDAVVTSLFFTNFVVRTCAIILRIPVIVAHEQNIYADKKRWQVVADKLHSFGTTKIVAVSNDVLSFTSAQEGIPREKFVVNFNTTPFDAFGNLPQNTVELRQRLGIPADTCVIATAGRLIEQKGHIYLIQAAAELRARHPEARFCVVIFGDGGLRGSLEAEITKLDLAAYIRMPGIWPAPDIMAVADIFVLPSLWEGTPVVVVEAMASAKPIITTRVSGSVELIEDGKSGFIVEPKDPSALREKMFLLMYDADMRNTFGANARERSKHFSMEKHMDVLEHLIVS